MNPAQLAAMTVVQLQQLLKNLQFQMAASTANYNLQQNNLLNQQESVQAAVALKGAK
jgi:hypothetical protein